VKAGAIIPMAPFAKSTYFIPKDILVIHVYTGADGSFRLYEDDGVSERYRTKNELRTTELRYSEQDLGLEVGAVQGTYAGSAASRSYQIVYHGLAAPAPLHVNTTTLGSLATPPNLPPSQDGLVWDADKKLLKVYLATRSVNTAFRVGKTSGMPSDGGPGGSVSGGAGGSVSGAGGGLSGGAGGSVTGGAGGTFSGSLGGNLNGGTGNVTNGGSQGSGDASAATKGTTSDCACHIGDVHRPSGMLFLVGIVLAMVGFHRTRKPTIKKS